MSDANREIQELLVDYAGTLRDGCIPTFLKSVTRQEAKSISSSQEFFDAAEMVRTLNGIGFADRAPTPEVGLFISRVDAEIASRLRKAKASPHSKHNLRARPIVKPEDKTEKSI